MKLELFIDRQSLDISQMQQKITSLEAGASILVRENSDLREEMAKDSEDHHAGLSFSTIECHNLGQCIKDLEKLGSAHGG